MAIVLAREKASLASAHRAIALVQTQSWLPRVYRKHTICARYAHVTARRAYNHARVNTFTPPSPLKRALNYDPPSRSSLKEKMILATNPRPYNGLELKGVCIFKQARNSALCGHLVFAGRYQFVYLQKRIGKRVAKQLRLFAASHVSLCTLTHLKQHYVSFASKHLGRKSRLAEHLRRRVTS